MVDCAPSMTGSITFGRCAALAVCAVLLAACGTAPPKPAPSPGAPPTTPSSKYYKDDGPGESPPANLDQMPDAIAAPRAAAPLRQPSVHGARPGLRAGDHAAQLQGARHRVVVRPQVPRPEDVDRRDLRHVRDDGGAPDAAAAVVCARHQRRDAARAWSCASTTAGRSCTDASSTCRTRPRTGSGIAGQGQRRGRGRGDHPRRQPDAHGAPRPCRRWPPRPPSDPGTIALPSPAPPSIAGRDAGGGFAVQLGAFQNYANAQNFLAHVQGAARQRAGRAEGARGQRAVPRLRRTVPGSRRSQAGGGPHHAGVRGGDRGRAALTRARNSCAGPRSTRLA